MKLREMSMKTLLDLHNLLADTAAGPKSFATKEKLIARIESIGIGKNIDLKSLRLPAATSAVERHMQPQADTAEADCTQDAKKTQTGRGIGRLARELLLEQVGYPHAVIANMVNDRIKGAQATAKSVRWYACTMRKVGTAVAKRQRPLAESEVIADAESVP